ncbi:MAG: hypothetical protein D4R65_01970 [Verrucomicrobiaceae bacterium]|nr:MAG: hypothetical protein D4R65_01970 [Verrucomicrobiaceae bacterium]
MPAATPPIHALLKKRGATLAVAALIGLGIWIRVDWMNRNSLWCDEAESSINALTILDRGLPLNEYLGIPVYENTLTEPWVGHPEYEFRDSSYSPIGLAVYHGWLPLYSIAASQALFGLRPDHPETPPRVLHGAGEIALRTVAPRAPAVVFATLCMLLTFLLARKLGGSPAGFAALVLTAFNARTVEFGYQARYYSATLLMTVFAAWCLLWTVRRGRWRDFLLLGLAEALLFHTHQFSAMVFAIAAAFTAPAIVRQKSWFLKSLAGGMVAVALILPWIWFSGFLHTASSVPKAYKLFSSLADWLAYTFERPDQLVLLGILITLLVLGKWRPGWLPNRIRAAIESHGQIYLLLLCWLAAGYVAFHLVVPAASFFFERLSLVLWTPYVLLISLFAADLLRGFSPRAAAFLAVAGITGFLGVRGRLALLQGPSLGSKRDAMAMVIEALENVPPEKGTRFYATPNEHLTLTYYTGLPVQSIAPVRRSFFDTYPGPLVYVESQMEWMFPDETDVRLAASKAGADSTPDGLADLGADVWRSLASQELAAQGLPAPTLKPLPDFLNPIEKQTHERLLQFREEFTSSMKALPIFRGIPATRMRDFWLGFFYRFVSPENRIGPNLNIFFRLKSAKIELLPYANTIIFYAPSISPHTSAAYQGENSTTVTDVPGAVKPASRLPSTP